MKKVHFVLILTFVLSSVYTNMALAQSKEQEVAREASQLKKITDTQWNEMIGSKNAETYEVQKGDTMWDISKRIFGDPYYWPKMWTFNNSNIRNPHFISPKMQLVFVGGSSEATPHMGASPADNNKENSTSNVAEVAQNSRGPHEYDKIPESWWAPPKDAQVVLKKYDAYGMDRELKIHIPSRFSFRVPAIANDSTVPFLGEIVSSRREGVYLSQNETVFLKSVGNDLQVGTTYSILSEPVYTKEGKSDRAGYIYKTLGEVKIVGIKDDLYIGLITSAFDVIKRGDRVYPLLPMIYDIKPMASANALEALVIQMNDSTSMTSQYRFLHLDRGVEDGVQIGQVFRIYDYVDPITKNKITDSDFLMKADAMIVHVTAQFSTALVIRARDTISKGDFGVSLTDVSDIEKIRQDQIKDFDFKDGVSPEDKELDELDKLDREAGEGLGRKEEQEIKELDNWDKTKDQPATPEDSPSEVSPPIEGEPSQPDTSTPDTTPQVDTMESIQNKEATPSDLPPEATSPQSKEDQTLDTPPVPTSNDVDQLGAEPMDAPGEETTKE